MWVLPARISGPSEFRLFPSWSTHGEVRYARPPESRLILREVGRMEIVVLGADRRLFYGTPTGNLSQNTPGYVLYHATMVRNGVPPRPYLGILRGRRRYLTAQKATDPTTQRHHIPWARFRHHASGVN